MAADSLAELCCPCRLHGCTWLIHAAYIGLGHFRIAWISRMVGLRSMCCDFMHAVLQELIQNCDACLIELLTARPNSCRSFDKR